jgi:trehalose 6-phosphate synthase
VTVLPNYDQLLPQLLQYDLVGFQTETDVGNFVRYLVGERRGADRGSIEATNGQFVFTSRGHKTRIGNFPVGIDLAQFERLARRAVRSPFVRDVVESLSGRALLIGVDRLDYSKGLVQRMEAIERFFDMYPAWRGKVTYLQIAPKSRSEIPTYAELEQAVGGAVGRINGKCGEIAWTPIRYLNRAFSRSTLAGLYRSARVAVVTPLRDGMNLVAKEYVAAQDAADPGVLILSRFTGAAVECEGALLVNPYDTESVARAIAGALDMTLAERRRRHEANLEALERNGGNEWSTRFLKSLQPGRELIDGPAPSGLDSLPPSPFFTVKDNRHGGSTA